MNFQTNRLQIEEINWNDIGIIHKIHSIPEIDEFNTLGIPENIDETIKIMTPDIEDQKKSTRSRFAWKIIEMEKQKLIGLAGMFLSNDRFNIGEFYYKFYPKYWGKGYATEAAKEIIRFGFQDLKLHRIEAGVATENKASIKVLEKAGMTCEGIRRKILPIRGVWTDNYQFSILEDEYK